MWNTFLKFKFKITFKITNLTIHVNSLFIYNTQLVSNYTKISMSLTWYLSWRKREQRRKNWKRDTKRIKTKEGTYPGSKLARASFIPWAISIQLLELTKPPLFTSCLINTLLLSAKVLSTFHSSYISLSLSSLKGLVEAGPSIFLRSLSTSSLRWPERGSSFLLSSACRSQKLLSLSSVFEMKATLRSLPFSILLHHHCFLYLYCIVTTRWQWNRRSIIICDLRASRQWDVQRIAGSSGVIVANENDESIITNRFSSKVNQINDMEIFIWFYCFALMCLIWFYIDMLSIFDNFKLIWRKILNVNLRCNYRLILREILS